jgi:hypothetical protein
MKNKTTRDTPVKVCGEKDHEETLFDYLKESDFITIIGNTECRICDDPDAEFYKKLNNYFCKECFKKYFKK